MSAYDIAFQYATPHGVISAVHIPDAPDPVPAEILRALPAEEAAYASGLRMYRQVSFVGGRIALRHAAAQVGVDPPPILPDDRGAPILPAPITGSISHKRTLAIAMVGQRHTGALGVDLEDYGPPRLAIAESVLTPRELGTLDGLSDDRKWIAVLMRFSIKESIYKAIDPFVRRYVGFHEADVEPDLEGGAQVTLDLEGGEGPFQVDARYLWFHGRLLTSVRIRDLRPRQSLP